jgi:D-threonate/D-erythronate kinase
LPQNSRFLSIQRIQHILTEIFNYLNKEINLGGIIIVGGDTVFNICSRLHVKGFKIYGEVVPFIPCGFAIGGILDGMPVITKAGGFGTVDTILRSIKYLKEETYCER